MNPNRILQPWSLSRTRMSSQGSKNHPDLVLSAWFFLYLHPDRSAGGLPTEFLTEGSSALLLFDSIGCDADALAWEKRFAKSWVSADLYAALEADGILQPMDLGRIAARSILPHLRETGISTAALQVMHAELEAIKRGKRPPERQRIPAALKELNKGMFAALGLELPDSVLYPNRGKYFRSSSRRAQGGRGGGPFDEAEVAKQQRHFMSAMRALIPQFPLLPRIDPNTESAAALQRNILKERSIVLRYAVGDPEITPDEITEYRLGPTFRLDDRKIDAARRLAAEKNLKQLLKIRRRTSDVRLLIRSLVADILAGTRTIPEVRKDLREAQRALASHIPQAPKLKVDLRLAGAAAAAALVEGAAAMLFGLHAFGAPSIAISTYELMRRRAEVNHNAALRRQYPLAVLTSEVDRARLESP